MTWLIALLFYLSKIVLNCHTRLLVNFCSVLNLLLIILVSLHISYVIGMLYLCILPSIWYLSVKKKKKNMTVIIYHLKFVEKE